jgi:hypothetical protein
MRALCSQVVFSGFSQTGTAFLDFGHFYKCPKSGSELQTQKSCFFKFLYFINKNSLGYFLHDFVFIVDKLPAAAHRLAHHA